MTIIYYSGDYEEDDIYYIRNIPANQDASHSATKIMLMKRFYEKSSKFKKRRNLDIVFTLDDIKVKYNSHNNTFEAYGTISRIDLDLEFP